MKSGRRHSLTAYEEYRTKSLADADCCAAYAHKRPLKTNDGTMLFLEFAKSALFTRFASRPMSSTLTSPDPAQPTQIAQAETAEQIAAVRELFEEYAAWLRVDLCFQGFMAELAGLPGAYAPPRGRLLLATVANAAVGCVALRPIDAAVCELKRLYVRPAYQGRGLGRALLKRVISDARSIGYTSIRLDTLPPMQRAIQLYESLGFARRSAYYETPLPDTVFLERLL